MHRWFNQGVQFRMSACVRRACARMRSMQCMSLRCSHARVVRVQAAVQRHRDIVLRRRDLSKCTLENSLLPLACFLDTWCWRGFSTPRLCSDEPARRAQGDCHSDGSSSASLCQRECVLGSGEATARWPVLRPLPERAGAEADSVADRAHGRGSLAAAHLLAGWLQRQQRQATDAHVCSRGATAGAPRVSPGHAPVLSIGRHAARF